MVRNRLPRDTGQGHESSRTPPQGLGVIAHKHFACLLRRRPAEGVTDHAGWKEDRATALSIPALAQQQLIPSLTTPGVPIPLLARHDASSDDSGRTETVSLPRRKTRNRALQQLRLTLDSVARLTVGQLCSLVKNRILKVHIFRFALWRWAPVDRQNAVGSFSDDLTARLRVLLSRDDEERSVCRHPTMSLAGSYLDDLSARLTRYRPGQADAVWANNVQDAEVDCNYQRFYLFDLALKNKSPTLCFELMIEWIKAHPPSAERPWETFNCALRTINWLRIVSMLKDEQRPSEEAWTKIANSIYLQARHIFATVAYHVPGNHVIVELFSLWLIAVSFPNFKQSPAWKAHAQRKLHAELHRQITTSGWHCEHCTHYHVQVLLIAMLWLHACDRIGESADVRLKEKLYKANQVIEKMRFRNSTLPMFGDSSFPFFHHSLSDDIALIGDIAEELFADLTHLHIAGSSQSTDIAERVGDYVVARMETAELVVDVGTIGYRRNPGHGHADMLSFVYASMGIPLFVDPGTREYAEEVDAHELKRACMHNTVSIAGADHAMLWRYFRWYLLPAEPRCSFAAGDNSFRLKASYSAFHHIGTVAHKRALYLTETSLSIVDSIRMREPYAIAINLIVGVGVDVDLGTDGVVRLVSSGHSWIVKQRGRAAWQVAVSDILIYPSYNFAVPSKRITFELGPIGNQTESHIIVRRQ